MSKRAVLIVEDASEDRHVCRRYLSLDEAHEYAFVDAEAGAQALVLWRQLRPDCIILDYKLPDVDGLSVLEALVGEAGEEVVAVVMLTGAGDTAVAIRALKIGAQDYLVKDDLTPRALQYAVDNAIGRVSLLRQLNQQRRELSRKNEEIARALGSLRLLEAGIAQTSESFVITTAELDTPGPQILFVNPAFTRMTGYTAAEVIGKTPRILQGPRTDRALLDALRGTLQRGEVVHGVSINYRKDGSEFVNEWRIAPVRDSDERITHFVASQRDVTERVRAEATRMESEERLQLIIEASEAAIWDWNIKTGEMFWSDRLHRIFALDPGMIEPSLAAFAEKVHPDDRERFTKEVIDHLERDAPYEIELRIRRADGFYGNFRGHGKAQRDVDGKAVRMVGSLTDITERKRREAREREDEERWRLALDAAQMGTWDWDTRTDTMTWSDSHYRIFGLGPGEFDGRFASFLALVHPDERGAIRAAVARTLGGGDSYDVEFRTVRPDGAVRWLVARGQAFCDEQGAPTRMAGVVLDITGRKIVEQELRESERFIQSILDTAPTALYIYDVITEESVLTSPQGARMLGYSPEELRTHTLSYLMHPDDQPRAAEHFNALGATTDGEVREFEYRMRHKNGAWRWILSRDRIFTRALDGRPKQILGIGQDITQRKRTEEDRAMLLAREQQLRAEAESVNRLKDEFLATLSHELRTPLTAILGWSRMLSSGHLDEARSRRAIEVIERSARAQQQLIEDILDVSRIIAGKLQLDVGPLDLIAVINAAVDAARITAEARGIQLQLSLDPEAGAVSGDAGRLQQVVWNLASNAVKFTPPGGRVAITLQRVGGAVRLVVTDTGQGITPEFLPFVFDRFRQADGSATRRQSGLGLGLAIVHHIVTLHGGTVRVESPGPGRGATFTLELPPRVEETPESEARRARSGGERGGPFEADAKLIGLRVIVVDDDRDMSDLLTTALTQKGAKVMAASSAREALELIDRRGADVLVSDIGMPTEDGHALIRRLRERERGSSERPIPAIALTAYAAESDRIEALASGFQRHMAKPVDLQELFASIEALVDVTHATRPARPEAAD